MQFVLGLRVQPGAGLVEDEQVPLLAEQGAGDRDPLLLPAGEVDPLLAPVPLVEDPGDERVVPVGRAATASWTPARRAAASIAARSPARDRSPSPMFSAAVMS
ncbi:hypothetical protein HFP72_08410 [Nocardiopsis sp. ARC36]